MSARAVHESTDHGSVSSEAVTTPETSPNPTPSTDCQSPSKIAEASPAASGSGALAAVSMCTTMPKRPISAYVFFVCDTRASVMAEHPEKSFKDTARIIARRWRALSAEGRHPYQEKARQEQLRYAREKAEWKRRPVLRGLRRTFASDTGARVTTGPPRSSRGKTCQQTHMSALGAVLVAACASDEKLVKTQPVRSPGLASTKHLPAALSQGSDNVHRSRSGALQGSARGRQSVPSSSGVLISSSEFATDTRRVQSVDKSVLRAQQDQVRKIMQLQAQIARVQSQAYQETLKQYAQLMYQQYVQTAQQQGQLLAQRYLGSADTTSYSAFSAVPRAAVQTAVQPTVQPAAARRPPGVLWPVSLGVAAVNTAACSTAPHPAPVCAPTWAMRLPSTGQYPHVPQSVSALAHAPVMRLRIPVPIGYGGSPPHRPGALQQDGAAGQLLASVLPLQLSMSPGAVAVPTLRAPTPSKSSTVLPRRISRR